MNIERNTLVLSGAALAAVILQVALSPYIAVFSAQPNFLLALVLAVAVLQNAEAGYVLPFALGLAFDFVSGGPVGAMAFLCLLFSALTSRICSVLENENISVLLMVFGVASLFVEVLYGALLLALGFPESVLSVFIYKALPCALYDMLVALLVHFVLRKLLQGASQGSALDTVRLR